MARRTVQTKDPSGTESKQYQNGKELIEALPYFLYEVCIHKYWKGGYALVGHRTFKTGSPLKIKESSIYREYEDYLIEKTISLLGAPIDYIREIHLPEYKPVEKPRKKTMKQPCKKRQS